ncbi:MAG: hypothetical protein ABJG86_19135 [Nitratireductor sp.]|uniref:hypothetical protein n=1 Tax=Alphaproteobacteria TaxID=28211 RepID=UPI003266EEF9
MNIAVDDAIGDRLNRLVKLAMDTGEAASLEEAERMFAEYRLSVSVGADIAHSPTLQATLLTIVNSARRSFLGGVEVDVAVDSPLLVPLSRHENLGAAVRALGGRITTKISTATPLICLGNVPDKAENPIAIRATFDGWTGGILPLSQSTKRLGEKQEFAPAGVLAGALAVTEAFQFLRRNQPLAGRREAGLSLWRPELSWQDSAARGPQIDRLPSSLWLVGLGNLGQAYLWTLGMLPYASPSEVQLVLQDFDVLAPSNESTSLLTTADVVGIHKTRAMAQWAQQRGFRSTIIERRFDANFRAWPDEPSLALCGVDNALARAALEDVGFGRIIEAGLGGGTADFLGFRTHVFPGVRKARDVWKPTAQSDESRIDLPAYEKLSAAGLDRCGLTRLAGRTVGAPFVGAIAGAVVIAETLRAVNGAHAYDLIDGHLRDLAHRTVVPAVNPAPFNPGATPVEL